MLRAKAATCSMMPSVSLFLFSFKLPIIIMEMTNVLPGESLPSRSQENVDTWSSQAPPSWSLAPLITFDILTSQKGKSGNDRPSQGRLIPFRGRAGRDCLKIHSIQKESDCVSLYCIARDQIKLGGVTLCQN